MKKIIILSVFLFIHSICNASEFQDSISVFATRVSAISNQMSNELSMVDRAHHSSQYFLNEIVVKLQPELGASVGVIGLKFAFSVEYTLARALPPNLELDKP